MHSSALLVLLLATTAAAQSVVVPSAAATTKPTGTPQFYNSNVFYSSTSAAPDSHTQMIYDVTDVGIAAGAWTSMQVRRPQGLGNANPAFTANVTIVMSVSPTVYTAMTGTFATNHGPSPTTVLTGSMNVSLPARTNPTAWPAPWEAPIPFTTPYVYVGAAGKSLVVDIMQTGNTGTTPWYLEARYPNAGDRASNPGAQSSCKFSNGSYNNVIGWQRPRLGAPWYVNYQGGLPTGMVGFGALGAQGVGGTYAGLPLPISLTPYGAPGCSWNVSADYIVALTSTTAVYQWPAITIPNDPALAGASFFDHAAFMDPAANPWGVVTTWSSRWLIGDNKGAPGAHVYAVGSSAGSPTGTFQAEVGVTLQLN